MRTEMVVIGGICTHCRKPLDDHKFRTTALNGAIKWLDNPRCPEEAK